MAMMTPQTLLSLVMALRPKFRSRSDRLAFAAHAFMIAQGFKLEAVGDDAEKASSADSIQCNEDEVDISKWNSSTDAYTFLYNPNLWQQGVVTVPILLKMVNLGDQLLLSWVTLKSSSQESQQVELKGPHQLELKVDNYTTSKAELPACYQNLADLIDKLHSKVVSVHGYLVCKPESSDTKSTAAASTRQEPLPDYGAAEDEFPSEPRRYVEPPIGGMGNSDAVPPGFRPPGYGGLQEPFPAGMGRSGGMHVGPDDPLFAGRSGMQRPGRAGVNPAGARYDPIGPPGMPGFNPDDFQTGRRPLHPDLAQPGPGRGTDWDSMFG